MFELSIEIFWQRLEAELLPNKYSNEHHIKYNDTFELQADAVPN